MKKTRRPYKKHKVVINENAIPVKDWMRQNEKRFKHIKGVPTSNQIGTVLLKEGFNQNITESEVIYTQ